MKRHLVVSFGLLFLLVGQVFAGTQMASTDPQNWRMENYVNGGQNVALWYADPSCTNGHIGFGGNATADDVNRLWITIALAKTTGKKIFVYFNNDGGANACTIVSFGLLEGS